MAMNQKTNDRPGPVDPKVESMQATLKLLGEQLVAARRAITVSEELYAHLAGCHPCGGPPLIGLGGAPGGEGSAPGLAREENKEKVLAPREAPGEEAKKQKVATSSRQGGVSGSKSDALSIPEGSAKPFSRNVPDSAPGGDLEEPLLGPCRPFSRDVSDEVFGPCVGFSREVSASSQECGMSASDAGTRRRKKHNRWGASVPGGSLLASMHVFADKDRVKEQLKKSLNDIEVYDVEDLYKTTGIWQLISRNEIFKNSTFVVIALNAAWIAIDTDYNKAPVLTDAPWEFQLVENIFCIYFSFELFARYMSFAQKRHAFEDGWFLFDGFLVLLMIWSTWMMPVLCTMFGGLAGSGMMQHTSIFRVLRLLRLTRVARLTRLLKDIPELMVLIKGMIVAMRAVFSTLCLLALVIYVFAILLTEMLADSEARFGSFENVPQSVNSLLLCGVFSSQADLIQKLLAVHWVYYLTMLAYAVVGSMTIMNMLIGVIVQVMQAVSEAETESMRAQTLKDMLGNLMETGDDNQNLSQADFRTLIRSPDTARALGEVHVNVLDLLEVADLLFEGRDTIPREDFVSGVMTYRGDKTASSTHLMQVCRRLEDHIDGMMAGKAAEGKLPEGEK